MSRHAGEFIIEDKLTSESSLGDEGDPPIVWLFKATRIDEPVAAKEPTEEEPSREDDIPVLIGPTPEATETPAPSPTPTWSWRMYQATATESAVRFGDLWGEVNVRPNDEDDDAYIFAELSTPLHHDDRIRTLTRSGAILSFSGMSIFIMKEDTTIVLDIAAEHKSKIKMLAGNVWIILKKMWTDGSMEIEMSQAVAGIKGTTLICEEANGVSTLKVLEGSVEFTSKATGEAVLVSGGQMVNADEDGLGEIEPFDIEEEMKGWHETAQQITADALKKNTGGRVVYVIIGAALALGAVTLVLIVVLLHVLGRKRSPVPAKTAATSPPSTQALMVSNKTITVSMDYDSGEGVYTGEVDSDGSPNGQGRFTMQQSDTGENWSYEGQWVSGQITGKGVMTEGDFIFKGSFISGLMDGNCEITDSGILRCKGMCSGGKLHGEGTLYTESGTLIFEGVFENDMLVESAADRKKRGEAFMPECVAMDALLYDLIMDSKDAMDYPVSVWGFPTAMSEQQATGTIAIEHIAEDSYPVCLVYRYGVDEPKMTWDDWINAWGVVVGTYEYEDADGLTVTCPKIEVIYWDNVLY